MLSPGQYHKQVPRHPLQNLLFRQFILESCEDSEFREGIMEMCRRDFVFFVDVFAIQFNRNPSIGDEIGPFICWEWQEEYALETIDVVIEKRRSMVWEKSREMSGTWLALLIGLWLCLLHENKKVVCMSHTIDAVDKPGEDDTLFAKFDFILEHLPKFMTEGMQRLSGLISFRGRSSISATASTKTAGVGSRVSLLILDEFSKYQQAAAVLSQTKATGPRLFIGTHYGVGTVYYDLTVRPDIYKKIFHWSMHPEKRKGLYRYNTLTRKVDVLDTSYAFPRGYQFVTDGTPEGGPFPGLRSVWYDEECRDPTVTGRDIAMHQDIDAKGATSQYFDSSIINSLKRNCVDPWFEGDIQYDPDTHKPLGFVSRPGGPVRLWCNLDLEGKPPVARYGGGGDVAAGTGNTPSCLSFINSQTGVKACEYVDPNIKPEQFSVVAFALCWMFTDANGMPPLFAWESNGSVGSVFGKEFMKLGYTNVYCRESSSSEAGDRFAKQTTTPGWWNTNNRNVEQMLSPYRAALQRGEVTNHSLYALEECLSYSYQDGAEGVAHSRRKNPSDPSSARENHGDIVISDGLAWKMCQKLGKVQIATPKEPPPSIYTLAGRRKLWEMKRQKEYADD